MSTIPGEEVFNPFGKPHLLGCPYNEGDIVLAHDDLNIINDCIGHIKSIDKAHSGEWIYTCKFDQGTFLLKDNQISNIKGEDI
tara:strand:- start:125 stop:373 length:249 start_codon:yes stop_codon:yes gene_type:complete